MILIKRITPKDGAKKRPERVISRRSPAVRPTSAPVNILVPTISPIFGLSFITFQMQIHFLTPQKVAKPAKHIFRRIRISISNTRWFEKRKKIILRFSIFHFFAALLDHRLKFEKIFFFIFHFFIFFQTLNFAKTTIFHRKFHPFFHFFHFLKFRKNLMISKSTPLTPIVTVAYWPKSKVFFFGLGLTCV